MLHMRRSGPACRLLTHGLSSLPMILLLLASLVSLSSGVVGLTATTGPGGNAALASSSTVSMGAVFSPAALQVATGTTVTWTGTDGRRHRVESTAGPARFDSGDLAARASWSFTFTVAGTYSYVDHRDRTMLGSVTVGSADPGPGTPPPTTASVGLAGRAFGPRTVTVAVNGVVTWTNTDNMPHNVTSDTGAFRSPTLQPGQVFTFRFTAPGTYPYNCTFHGGMTGTVIVPTASGSVPPPPSPAPSPTVSAPGGSAPPPVPGSTKTYQVQVGDNFFAPATLNARVGDTIVWTNIGRMPHTVTADNGEFNHQLDVGQTFRYALRTQGRLPYFCAFHPGMSASLTVNAPLPGVSVPPPVMDNGGGSGSGHASAPPPPASTEGARTIEVKAQEMSFSPNMVDARVGDTISWVNVGSIPHTVTAKDGSFDKVIAPGERFNLVLRKQGTVNYVCTFHPGMDGMLMVGAALPNVAVPAVSESAPAPDAVTHRHATTTTYQVQVKDNSFSPGTVNARVGDTVVWTNTGLINHTVTANDGSFDRILKPGESFTLRLADQRTIEYVCTPHRGMFGTIVVGPPLSPLNVAAGPWAAQGWSTISMILISIGSLLFLAWLSITVLHGRPMTLHQAMVEQKKPRL